MLAVGLCSAEPLSFDDLYKAADSFDDPQPVKKAAAEPEVACPPMTNTADFFDAWYRNV